MNRHIVLVRTGHRPVIVRNNQSLRTYPEIYVVYLSLASYNRSLQNLLITVSQRQRRAPSRQPWASSRDSAGWRVVLIDCRSSCAAYRSAAAV
jgi:hypothetical protein